MEWIRVTPETMPPDMVPVLVTVTHNLKDESIKKYTVADIRYNHQNGWEFLSNSCFGIWGQYTDNVTHWMPMPEPAED